MPLSNLGFVCFPKFAILLLFFSQLNAANLPTMHNSLNEDLIECYFCNSRDVHCTKRITDTLIPTVHCPSNNKCVLYTNPYDNYYLHRGCSSNMEFDTTDIENGCFIEEDGSIYCFCDFNRCNSASIFELRNLDTNKSNEQTTTITSTTTTTLDHDLHRNANTSQTRKMPAVRNNFIPFKNIIKALYDISADDQVKVDISSLLATSDIITANNETANRPLKTLKEATSNQTTRLLSSDATLVNRQQIFDNQNTISTFTCSSDGLFKHPNNCSKFLQCVFYGSVHQKYYVFDCPAKLYFNEKLGFCDYQ